MWEDPKDFTFCERISEKYEIPVGKMDSWTDAMKLYVRLSGHGKKIFVIDEFQYITKSDRNAEHEFQSIWDNILSKSDVMFIISGSYTTLMKELTRYDRPLYGRNTCDLFLRPLDFRTCLFDERTRFSSDFYDGD